MEPNVITHPLVADRLRIVRDASSDTAQFRSAMEQLGQMLSYEALTSLDSDTVPVTTPVTETTGTYVHRNVLFVPVLRAGLGILDAALRLVPEASIGFVGMARNEESHVPEAYLASLPKDLDQKQIFVLDPMLATGGSLIATCEELVSRGARHITAVCVLCAPEGIAALQNSGLPVSLVTASIDERLNEDAFIVPGLGDAGDRLFGPR
ncbi:MAG TPA: uracil phosphoribosyltransferase [Dietzia timorensis]|uniref:Uracil phosphoribosyltransferase n=1 Tax=Dietzia timorensis TaxID=499555 RepID=A0A921JXG7_9ACTN|nr:uracil phosphoribosyltransferase [Dietzia timorensis]HJE89957.1 uracil phosphoribosyltransferase [Dietzia timorensis]